MKKLFTTSQKFYNFLVIQYLFCNFLLKILTTVNNQIQILLFFSKLCLFDQLCIFSDSQ